MDGQFFVCGNSGKVRDATPEIQEIVNKVKHLIEARLNQKFAELTAVQFRKQVVAGMNYFVKVRSSNNDHFHVRIFKNFDDILSVDGIQTGKSASDAVDFFDEN